MWTLKKLSIWLIPQYCLFWGMNEAGFSHIILTEAKDVLSCSGVYKRKAFSRNCREHIKVADIIEY
jgi:hypothetical protein